MPDTEDLAGVGEPEMAAPVQNSDADLNDVDVLETLLEEFRLNAPDDAHERALTLQSIWEARSERDRERLKAEDGGWSFPELDLQPSVVSASELMLRVQAEGFDVTAAWQAWNSAKITPMRVKECVTEAMDFAGGKPGAVFNAKLKELTSLKVSRKRFAPSALRAENQRELYDFVLGHEKELLVLFRHTQALEKNIHSTSLYLQLTLEDLAERRKQIEETLAPPQETLPVRVVTPIEEALGQDEEVVDGTFEEEESDEEESDEVDFDDEESNDDEASDIRIPTHVLGNPLETEGPMPSMPVRLAVIIKALGNPARGVTIARSLEELEKRDWLPNSAHAKQYVSLVFSTQVKTRLFVRVSRGLYRLGPRAEAAIANSIHTGHIMR